METKVLDKKNISDVVGQSEKEEKSHFRISPLYSRVHRLHAGLNIGPVSVVDEDAKYSLNAGFVACIGNSQSL